MIRTRCGTWSWGLQRVSLHILKHVTSPLWTPMLCGFLRRWPSEDMEETVVHPYRQLPLLLRIHNSKFGRLTRALVCQNGLRQKQMAAVWTLELGSSTSPPGSKAKGFVVWWAVTCYTTARPEYACLGKQRGDSAPSIEIHFQGNISFYSTHFLLLCKW